MILETIRNIFKPRHTVTVKEYESKKQEKPESESKLPMYIYYDKTNNKYRIQRKGEYYGRYTTLEEAKEALNKLKTSNWDILTVYDFPSENVTFDNEKRTFKVHKIIDDVDYCFGEYKQARAVQKKLKELNQTGWQTKDSIHTHEIDSVNPYHHEKYPQGSYYYDVKCDCFTTPNKQGKSLMIDKTEAFNIIRLRKAGYNLSKIYDKINWKHREVSTSTLKNWWQKYAEGKMDLALNFIIVNGYVSEDVWKK